MDFKVIGSGFGRTGTYSLKLALEQLGFGPCYHMAEMDEKSEDIEFWQNSANRVNFDASELLAEYKSAVDWPTTYFWKELWAQNPNAKIIHTYRDAESWYESCMTTIYPSITKDNIYQKGGVNFYTMAHKLILENTFGGRFEDKEYAISVYEMHTEKVKSSVPKEQLLLFSPAEGWEPICDFLECEIPKTYFPRSNTRKQFIKNAGL